MKTKKTDAEIEQVVIDGVQDLLCRDIEELIDAGRYKEAMIVARDVLGSSESELKEIEEIIETEKQFRTKLFKNYKAMREWGYDPDGARESWSPALKRLPELKKREVVAHCTQMHKFLELAYIFGDCSKGDRQQSWSKWLAKLSKDGVKDPHVFADGFFQVVDATAPYS